MKAVIGLICLIGLAVVLFSFLGWQLEYDQPGGEIAITVILIIVVIFAIIFVFTSFGIKRNDITEQEIEERKKAETKSLNDQF
jgi:uncharacterized membrane protein